jgi:hypothetical protein
VLAANAARSCNGFYFAASRKGRHALPNLARLPLGVGDPVRRDASISMLSAPSLGARRGSEFLYFA